MSKNIVIQEGGLGKQLTADKLKTNLVGGGTCLWAPEDEVQLTTKTITEDGTYKASDDGYYGYSQVSVSGIGKVTGTDPSTGEEVEVTTDPETGEIVEKVLPSSIAVTTPPSKTVYNDGEGIQFDGMVVKAYKKSGELWTDKTHANGIIPHSELSFPVTNADAGQADALVVEDPVFDGATHSGTINAAYMGSVFTIGTLSNNTDVTVNPFNSKAFTLIGRILVSAYSSEESFYLNTPSSGVGPRANSFTHNGRTVYYGRISVDHYGELTLSGAVPSTNVIGLSEAEIAWLMLYDESGGSHTAMQYIPVQYDAGYGDPLEASFGITVNAAPGVQEQ